MAEAFHIKNTVKTLSPLLISSSLVKKMATCFASSTFFRLPLHLCRKPSSSFVLPKFSQACTGIGTRNQRMFVRRIMAAGASQEPVEVTRSVPVRVAHELLLAGHRYLDVRTEEEFNGGHAPEAINVPYMFSAGSGMTKNPNFLEEVLSHFGKDDEIIVGCKSGKRSLMASTDLLYAGFTGVTDIAGGYLAWVQNGLPTQ